MAFTEECVMDAKDFVGKTIPTWFSDRWDGRSAILYVAPYHGKYRDAFDCVLTLTAPRTPKRSIEMAANSADVAREITQGR